MRISNVSFKRALTPVEMNEYKRVMQHAKEKTGGVGQSIMVVHDACLPQNSKTDTGIGHLTSKSADEFFDFVNNRMGINAIEVLPQGDITYKHKNGFYNGYNGSALSLGSHEIDLELLTDEKFGSILSKEDLQKVVDANIKSQKVGFVNYENIIGINTPHENALKKAFKNYMENPNIDKTKFNQYKIDNRDWLDKKAVYSVLYEKNNGQSWKNWSNEVEKTLFDVVDDTRTTKINTIMINNAESLEFYKFKQFIADEHLKLGKEKLNKKGMKLFGDCLIGFGEDEVWAYKKAFKKDIFVGLKEWGLPALDYNEILNDGSAAQSLLKRKVELFAKRYDGIRFDCSWSYVQPKLSDQSEYKFSDKLLNFIENTVKAVKGEKFVQTDLIHEFEADPSDFSVTKSDGIIKPYLKNKMHVITSAFLGETYGTNKSIKKTELSKDNYVLGVGNHDPQPLRQVAENLPDLKNKKHLYKRPQQARVLESIFGYRPGSLDSATEFSKTKLAEPLMAKNNIIFYMDALGRSERFDSQELNCWKNYRYRIAPDFAKEYDKTIALGFGYNPMDAFERIFRLKGLDKKEKSLYSKIVKFKNIIENKTVNIVENIKNTKETRKNKIVNMVALIVGLGVIGTVIKSTQNSLQKLDK